MRSSLVAQGNHGIDLRRAVSPERVAALDDSVFVETALMGPFGSSTCSPFPADPVGPN